MLITIEGLDGAGKSTLIDFLSVALKERGKPYVVFREPGSTPFGEKIRTIVTTDQRPTTSASRALLFVASRNELIKTRIETALAEGKVVIMDRFYPSTFAYSPVEDWEWLDALHQGLGISTLPNQFTFFLDVNFETSQQRMASRKLDAIEHELALAFEEYRQRYLKYFEEKGAAYLIDANVKPSAIFTAVWTVVKAALLEKKDEHPIQGFAGVPTKPASIPV